MIYEKTTISTPFSTPLSVRSSRCSFLFSPSPSSAPFLSPLPHPLLTFSEDQPRTWLEAWKAISDYKLRTFTGETQQTVAAMGLTSLWIGNNPKLQLGADLLKNAISDVEGDLSTLFDPLFGDLGDRLLPFFQKFQKEADDEGDHAAEESDD